MEPEHLVMDTVLGPLLLEMDVVRTVLDVALVELAEAVIVDTLGEAVNDKLLNIKGELIGVKEVLPPGLHALELEQDAVLRHTFRRYQTSAALRM